MKKNIIKKLQMAKIDHPNKIYKKAQQFIVAYANGEDESFAFEDGIKNSTTNSF
ncbi:hypothetical protein [Chryseobacterium lathyri]|uniref:hypothetical protein n=1 Tax=Chryseobacterium lathyri TaxID=395933 RepID=UPI001CC1ACFB|nr:hypothetical protein [Chryseobacterium lathyri]